jgi:alpha-glutamyl/putrescinyl thymine pyrophosphorylase-like protein
VRPVDSALGARIRTALAAYEEQHVPLPGLTDAGRRLALVEQIVESVRRRQYIERIQDRHLSPLRMDPRSDLFDPIKAAILHARAGDTEEACWLAFLSIHFGRHRRGGWRYCAAIYGGAGDSERWEWRRVSSDVVAFTRWVAENEEWIRKNGGGFGNHRKYESLGATAVTVASYVSWVGPRRSQMRRFREVTAPAKGNPTVAFDLLYESMSAVARFGRTARFDYLTLLSRLGFVPIVPARAYLPGATGPLKGARLLFGNSNDHARLLDDRLNDLDRLLNVGLDVMEDALCNWQKSPSKFLAFRG